MVKKTTAGLASKILSGYWMLRFQFFSIIIFSTNSKQRVYDLLHNEFSGCYMETQLLIQFDDPIQNPVTSDTPVILDPPRRPLAIPAEQRYPHVRVSIPAKTRVPIPRGNPTPPSEPGFPLPWMEGLD